MSRRFLFAVILFSAIVVCATLPDRASSDRPSLEVVFLDVGQGDASLIRTPYGQNILIDGGPDGRVLEGLARNLPWFERRIDLMVLTHQHEDHLAGLLKVFERYEVERVVYGSASGSPAMAAAFLEALKDEGSWVEKPPQKQRIELGEGCDLLLFNPAYLYGGKDLNERSLVLKLDCGMKVLFTGDAGSAVESGLLDEGEDVSSDVLKVGHHGSSSASTEDFLRSVHPAWAVISVGSGNRYGLPKQEIERRLLRLGAKVLRTDQVGAVKFKFDGKGVEVSP